MRVAIPVWDDRISPVFDAATTFLVADIADGRIAGRRLLLCPERREEVVRLLLEAGVETLICGAISREPAQLLEERGIRLIPFIAGMAEQVLSKYAGGSSIMRFRMPGCRRAGRGSGFRCACRANRGAVRSRSVDEEQDT